MSSPKFGQPHEPPKETPLAIRLSLASHTRAAAGLFGHFAKRNVAAVAAPAKQEHPREPMKPPFVCK